MKKLLSIVIILTMLVGLFSACSNQNGQTSTDTQTNTQADDTQTDTSSTQENTTPEVKKEEYYKSYRLMSRDLKKGISNNTATLVDSYEALKMFLDMGVIDSFDKSMFDDNIVFIACLESDGAIGFRSFNGKKIECDSLNYIYDKYEYDEEKLEQDLNGPELDYNYLVLIPKSKSLFLYNQATTSINVEINTLGDYPVTAYTDVDLGSEPYIRVLKTKAEYDAYIKETGLRRIPAFAQNKMIVAHYEPSYDINRYAISYERGSLENKTLELCATHYYENDSIESTSGALNLIFVPYDELAQDPEFEIVISVKKHINIVQAVKNKSYIDYYKTIDILYNTECNKFAYLPTDYGTYFWLAETSSELKALYGCEAYESFINEYNVLVIYRCKEMDTTTITGFHSFKIENGKMQITVNEYDNNFSTGSEHDQRMLAFVCIPKSEFTSLLKPTKLELISNKLEYYKSSTVSASYSSTKGNLILNITYGEFVNEWNEEKIPQISSSTFERYYLLAIKSKSTCSCCNHQVGYYGFYAPENETMHISLDEEMEYGKLCDLWEFEGYDLILIPKEEFPPLYTFDYEKIKVHENKIITNYKRLYEDITPDVFDKLEIKHENPKYYKEFSSSYTVIADGVVYEEDQIFLDGIFEPKQKSQYIALTSRTDLEAFTLLNHNEIDESIFNYNYIVAILHYTLGPSIGGPTSAGFYNGSFDKTSAQVKMDTYYNYGYNATENKRDVYRLYFVAVPKESVSTINEVCNLSIEEIKLEQYDMAVYSNHEHQTDTTQTYFLANRDALDSLEIFDGIIPAVSFPLIAIHLSEPIYAEYIVNSFCYTGERIYIKIQLLKPRELNDSNDWGNMIFVSLSPHRADINIELPESIAELENCPIYVVFETITSIN